MTEVNPNALNIKRAAAHKIFEKEDGQTHSSFEKGRIFDQLPVDIVDVIKSRLIQVVGNKGKSHQLEISSFDEGSFFKACSILSDRSPSEFIDSTLEITSLLASSQRRKAIKASYLWVIDAEDKDTAKKVWIIIKAELHEALTIDADACKVLKEVFLSPTQKMYKVGILYEREHILTDKFFPNNTYGCLLFDSSWSGRVAKLANYFCKDFLGFSYENIAKYQISALYDHINDFINKSDLSSDERVQALENVVSYFQISDEINPDDIGDIISQDQSIINDFKDSVYTFPGAIKADVDMIKNKINKYRLPFENNVIINGPLNSFGRTVKVVDTVDKLKSFVDEILTSIEGGLPPNFTVVRIDSKPIFKDEQSK